MQFESGCSQKSQCFLYLGHSLAALIQLADMVFRQRGLIIDRALEVSGWNVMQRYVKAGVGITMVPDICVSDRDRVRKIPASDAFPARDYSIFVRKDSTLPLAAERFLGIVKRDTAQEG